jgi:hypothetical protein
MAQTAIEWLEDKFQSLGFDFEHILKQAKKMEEIEKLKRQLFMGKVSEIIGMNKTIELWKECIETFKSE